jgi:hypothetical protein
MCRIAFPGFGFSRWLSRREDVFSRQRIQEIGARISEKGRSVGGRNFDYLEKR